MLDLLPRSSENPSVTRRIYEVVSPISHGDSKGRKKSFVPGQRVTWRDFDDDDEAQGRIWLEGALRSRSILERNLDAEEMMKLGKKGKWQPVQPLGKGGQGTAYKALDTTRVDLEGAARKLGLGTFTARQGRSPDIKESPVELITTALKAFREVEDPANHGALKVLHQPEDPDEYTKALERMSNEIRAYESVSHPSLLRLLDHGLEEGWLVTEFQPGGTLDSDPGRFRGDAQGALRAIRPLVEAVAMLHGRNMVHRDIKPANVFFGEASNLILGDAGLVFFKDDSYTRISDTLENVGSRDWMAPWASGVRIDEIRPSFDLFSLGKLLWAMVSGRPKLRNWYHRRPEFDLEKQFPDDEAMGRVNRLLDGLVVEDQENQAIGSTDELLREIDQAILLIRRGAQILRDGIKRRCQVCGTGSYAPVDAQSAALVGLSGTKAFRCGDCGHIQFFRFGPQPPSAWQDKKP